MYSEPKYTQPDVLEVTRLKPAVLQTWVNRGAIDLSEQNPGSGRKRKYSAIDVVKLAVMRRMADLRIDLSVAKEIAEAAGSELANGGGIHWDEYIFLRPDDATDSSVKFDVICSSGISALAKYGARIGDPAHMRVSDFVEPDRHIIKRRPDLDLAQQLKRAEEGLPEIPEVDEQRRAYFASQGFHAEPVIIFPIGEIVNGALMQLEAKDAEG